MRWRRPRGSRRARGRMRRRSRCAACRGSASGCRRGGCGAGRGWRSAGRDRAVPCWRFGERRADPRFAGVVPGGLDQQPSGERRAGLGDRPCRSDSPDCCRDGVSPSHDPRRCGFSKRSQSAPSSRWIVSAVSVSTPRKHAQPGDGRPPLLVGRQPRDPLGERLLAGGQPVDARRADQRRSAR